MPPEPVPPEPEEPEEPEEPDELEELEELEDPAELEELEVPEDFAIGICPEPLSLAATLLAGADDPLPLQALNRAAAATIPTATAARVG